MKAETLEWSKQVYSMDPSDFHALQAGRVLQTPTGRAASVPTPLPPR